MTLLPVIVRELRSQARQPATYWLRSVAAGAVFAAFVLLLFRLAQINAVFAVTGAAGIGNGNPFSQFGTVLFGLLNATIFTCGAFLAPLLTADCIARERREGTLGLLFLTDLNAVGIVAGKAFVHALRGAMLFCAMLPVLTIPVLLGGVTALDGTMALLIDSIVLLLGLSAGIVASTYTRDWIKAFVLAELLSFLLVLSFMYFHAEVVARWIIGGGWFGAHHSIVEQFFELFVFHTNLLPSDWSNSPVWSDFWSSGTSLVNRWFVFVGGCALGALFLLLLAVLVAALRIRHSWRDAPHLHPATEPLGVLTRPRFATRTLRRRLSRSLDRNPIGWLQHYSWSGRITKWSWLAALVLVESFAVADVWNFAGVQPLIELVFFAAISFTAAASFREERESGALELLLVCPLTVAQLMWGRLRGIWAQYLPGFALLLVCLAIGADIESYNGEKTRWFYAVTITAFVTLPVIGLFFSLLRPNFLAGWLWTMGVGLGVPLLAADQQRLVSWLFGTANAEAVVFCLQWTLAVVFWLLLYERLKQRRFVIHA